MKKFESHGSGHYPSVARLLFKKIGEGVIFERDVLIWHPENIEIGDNVYVGHRTMLKAYHKNKMIIKDNVWIGQCCYFHSAGYIRIEGRVGIGPYVKILTSVHDLEKLTPQQSVIEGDLKFGGVWIGYGADIGVGSILLPHVTIGYGAVVGAGSVVTKNIPPMEIWAGNPAKFLRKR